MGTSIEFINAEEGDYLFSDLWAPCLNPANPQP